jgi:hypothetical protein
MSRLVNDRGVNKFAFRPSATARNTILILSGYLLGSTVAHVTSPILEGGALAAGLIGALAYVVSAGNSKGDCTHRAADGRARANCLSPLDVEVARGSILVSRAIYARGSLSRLCPVDDVWKEPWPRCFRNAEICRRAHSLCSA